MDGAGGRVGISLANSDDSLQVTANPVLGQEASGIRQPVSIAV
jgi:hypothetical protein